MIWENTGMSDQEVDPGRKIHVSHVTKEDLNWDCLSFESVVPVYLKILFYSHSLILNLWNKTNNSAPTLSRYFETQPKNPFANHLSGASLFIDSRMTFGDQSFQFILVFY